LQLVWFQCRVHAEERKDYEIQKTTKNPVSHFVLKCGFKPIWTISWQWQIILCILVSVSLYQVSGSDPQTSKTTIFNGAKISVSLIQFNIRTFKVRHSADTLLFVSPILNAQNKEIDVQSLQTYTHTRVDDFCILSQWKARDELHTFTQCLCLFDYITCTNLYKWQRCFAVTWTHAGAVLSGLRWWNLGCSVSPNPPPFSCPSIHVNLTTGWATSDNWSGWKLILLVFFAWLTSALAFSLMTFLKWLTSGHARADSTLPCNWFSCVMTIHLDHAIFFCWCL